MATHGGKVGPQDWQLFSIYPSQNEGSLIYIYIYICVCVCQYVYIFESYPNIYRCMAKTGHWEATSLELGDLNGWNPMFFVLRGLHGKGDDMPDIRTCTQTYIVDADHCGPIGLEQ